MITQTDHNEVFAPAGLVSSTPVIRDITAPTVSADLQTKARRRLTAIGNALGQVAGAQTTLTNIGNTPIASVAIANTAVHQLAAIVSGVVTNQAAELQTSAAIIRLLMGALFGATDLLDDTATDTAGL